MNTEKSLTIILVPIIATLYFFATGAIEGWRERIHSGLPDNHWLIRDDGQRPFATYHHWRIVQTAALVLLAGLLMHSWLIVPLFIGCDRLYTRIMVWVEYGDIFKLQPKFIIGKASWNRPPVWVDFALIVVCFWIVIKCISH